MSTDTDGVENGREPLRLVISVVLLLLLCFYVVYMSVHVISLSYA